jgi:hypothetical protein
LKSALLNHPLYREIDSLPALHLFGREDLLPGLFRKIMNELNASIGGDLDPFCYYLHRHIGSEGNEHGPMATRLILSLCGADEAKWQEVEEAAVTALESRRDLWDSIYDILQQRRVTAGEQLASK